MKVVTEQPLAELILRKYEKPDNLKERELVKKICLSLGLLQPGDSRDVVVDVLHVLLKAKKRRLLLSVSELEVKIIQNRKLHRLQLLGIASSNIRRQVKRLRSLLIVEKMKSKYRITEFMPLDELYTDKIEAYLLGSIRQRLREYLRAADDVFVRKSKQ